MIWCTLVFMVRIGAHYYPQMMQFLVGESQKQNDPDVSQFLDTLGFGLAKHSNVPSGELT